MRSKNARSVLVQILFFLFLMPLVIHAQSTLPFANEVKQIEQQIKSIRDASKPAIVFTGSSSIRLWKDLQQKFPGKQILNTGFGGSQASDLKNFLHQLILDHDPVQVFIYEGDNDISSKKRPKTIANTFQEIIAELHKERPDMEIVLISAKPSIARWHLRGKFKRLNKKLRKIASRTDGVVFADVWNAMLNGRKLKLDIFTSDGLHMNAEGYNIWFETIKRYVNKNTP